MKVLLVSKGDAQDIHTWSGVPNGLLTAFEQGGNEVALCNIFTDFWFHGCGMFWNHLFTKIIRRWHRIPFEATHVGGWLMRRYVIRMIKRVCPDLVIAMTLALDGSGFTVPTLLIHDWTFGYAAQYLGGRIAALNASETAAEKRVIDRMRNATRALILYPESAEYLIRNHRLENVLSVRLPVRRCPSKSAVYPTKDGLRHLIVFGSPWHMDNVEIARIAVELLSDKRIVLDVIGISGKSSASVRYHGYLRHDNISERDLYWQLMMGAVGVVAAGSSWPGGSSVAEALGCGVPVIMGNWPDMVNLWGSVEEYGVPCVSGDPISVAEAIKKLLSLSQSDYLCLSQRAKTSIHGETFEELAEKVIHISHRL